MSQLKHSIDAPFIGHWPELIGKLIINFSGLELEKYQWLGQMSEQPERTPVFAKQKFSQRIAQIKHYIEEKGFSANWKADSLSAWDDGLKLAKVRNRIAHNPLAFSWANDQKIGEPDYIGITEIQGLEQSKDGVLLSKSAIKLSINQFGDLMNRLMALRQEWCKHRDMQAE